MELLCFFLLQFLLVNGVEISPLEVPTSAEIWKNQTDLAVVNGSTILDILRRSDGLILGIKNETGEPLTDDGDLEAKHVVTSEDVAKDTTQEDASSIRNATDITVDHVTDLQEALKKCSGVCDYVDQTESSLVEGVPVTSSTVTSSPVMSSTVTSSKDNSSTSNQSAYVNQNESVSAIAGKAPETYTKNSADLEKTQVNDSADLDQPAPIESVSVSQKKRKDHSEDLDDVKPKMLHKKKLQKSHNSKVFPNLTQIVCDIKEVESDLKKRRKKKKSHSTMIASGESSTSKSNEIVDLIDLKEQKNAPKSHSKDSKKNGYMKKSASDLSNTESAVNESPRHHKRRHKSSISKKLSDAKQFLSNLTQIESDIDKSYSEQKKSHKLFSKTSQDMKQVVSNLTKIESDFDQSLRDHKRRHKVHTKKIIHMKKAISNLIENESNLAKTLFEQEKSHDMNHVVTNLTKIEPGFVKSQRKHKKRRHKTHTKKTKGKRPKMANMTKITKAITNLIEKESDLDKVMSDQRTTCCFTSDTSNMRTTISNLTQMQPELTGIQPELEEFLDDVQQIPQTSFAPNPQTYSNGSADVKTSIQPVVTNTTNESGGIANQQTGNANLMVNRDLTNTNTNITEIEPILDQYIEDQNNLPLNETDEAKATNEVKAANDVIGTNVVKPAKEMKGNVIEVDHSAKQFPCTLCNLTDFQSIIDDHFAQSNSLAAQHIPPLDPSADVKTDINNSTDLVEGKAGEANSTVVGAGQGNYVSALTVVQPVINHSVDEQQNLSASYSNESTILNKSPDEKTKDVSKETTEDKTEETSNESTDDETNNISNESSDDKTNSISNESSDDKSNSVSNESSDDELNSVQPELNNSTDLNKETLSETNTTTESIETMKNIVSNLTQIESVLDACIAEQNNKHKSSSKGSDDDCLPEQKNEQLKSDSKDSNDVDAVKISKSDSESKTDSDEKADSKMSHEMKKLVSNLTLIASDLENSEVEGQDGEVITLHKAHTKKVHSGSNIKKPHVSEVTVALKEKPHISHSKKAVNKMAAKQRVSEVKQKLHATRMNQKKKKKDSNEDGFDWAHSSSEGTKSNDYEFHLPDENEVSHPTDDALTNNIQQHGRQKKYQSTAGPKNLSKQEHLKPKAKVSDHTKGRKQSKSRSAPEATSGAPDPKPQKPQKVNSPNTKEKPKSPKPSDEKKKAFDWVAFSDSNKKTDKPLTIVLKHASTNAAAAEVSVKEEKVEEEGKTETIEKAGKVEKQENIEKTDKAEKEENIEKTDKDEKEENIEKTDKGEKQENIEKTDKAEKQENIEKTDKAEKEEKIKKTKKAEKMKKDAKIGKEEKTEKDPKIGKEEIIEKAEKEEKEKKIEKEESMKVVDYVSPKDLREMIQVNEAFVIDLREMWEIKYAGKIADSIHIAMNSIELALKLDEKKFQVKYGMKKPSLSDCGIVFVDSSGKRSDAAVKFAKKNGYKCPKSLKGGFDQWKQELGEDGDGDEDSEGRPKINVKNLNVRFKPRPFYEMKKKKKTVITH